MTLYQAIRVQTLNDRERSLGRRVQRLRKPLNRDVHEPWRLARHVTQEQQLVTVLVCPRYRPHLHSPFRFSTERVGAQMNAQVDSSSTVIK